MNKKKSHNIILSLSTKDLKTLANSFGISNFNSDTKIHYENEISLRFLSKLQKKSFPPESIIELALSFPTGVVAGIVGTWLYEKIKKKCSKVRLNGEDTKITKEDISLTISIVIRKKNE